MKLTLFSFTWQARITHRADKTNFILKRGSINEWLLVNQFINLYTWPIVSNLYLDYV